MAIQKTDVIFLGRSGINDNTNSIAFFTANNIVEIWNVGNTYAQYNVVEYSGSVYRSKVALNVGNNPASSPNHWEVLYRGVKNGDFAFVLGAGATILQRQGGLWLVFGNHPAEIVYYDEPMVVVSGAPSTDNEISGPVSIGTNIFLPLDSRDANTTEQYVVGSGDLEVRLNGNKLVVGSDWTEVGAPSSLSNQVQIQIPLVVDDQIVFRRHSTINLTGYGGTGGGGGGGGGDLQDAYNAGNTIAVTPGAPFTVSGGGPGKTAVFNGDIDVTGVIDPKGITFSREASDPLPAQDGLWVNSAGELNYKQFGSGNTNISNLAANEAVLVSLKNDTGSTIPSGMPVCLDSNGKLKLVNVSQESDAESFVGLTYENISNGTFGKVITAGKITSISTSIAFGSALYISKTGTITDTKPDIGVGGFVVGDWVIKLGVISQNIITPANKDVIINFVNRGQL